MLQQFLDTLIADGTFAGLPRDVAYLIGMLLAGAVVVFGFVLNVAGVTTFVERRVLGAYSVAYRPEPCRTTGYPAVVGGRHQAVDERGRRSPTPPTPGYSS